MELNITRFFHEGDASDFSASRMELGDDAGPITWKNACEAYPHFYILNNKDKRAAFRKHALGYGAWTELEIASWNHNELNALLIQMISGDIRDTGMEPSEWDWEHYEELSQAGTYSSRLFKGIDDQIYYTIGD
jgi:hypothetical protein